MKKYTAVAIVAVSIVAGVIAALLYDRGDIALALSSLGGTLGVALASHKGPATKEND